MLQATERGRVAVHATVQDMQSPRWSPDGQTIYFLSAGNLYSVPSTGGNPNPAPAPRPNPRPLNWWAHGRHVQNEPVQEERA